MWQEICELEVVAKYSWFTVSLDMVRLSVPGPSESCIGLETLGHSQSPKSPSSMFIYILHGTQVSAHINFEVRLILLICNGEIRKTLVPFKSVYKYRKQCKKMAWDFGRDPVCGQENLDQTQCMNSVENSYRTRLPVLGLGNLLSDQRQVDLVGDLKSPNLSFHLPYRIQ